MFGCLVSVLVCWMILWLDWLVYDLFGLILYLFV